MRQTTSESASAIASVARTSRIQITLGLKCRKPTVSHWFAREMAGLNPQP
jgi:hypothetical protein